MTAKELLTWFMENSRGNVFFNFERMEGAVGSRTAGYVFVPGSLPPERRPLLVAHADTVWDGRKNKPNIRVEWDGNVCTSANRSQGIGADDRAGCAMLWQLSDSGASLLLTDEEETGCVGARKAAAEILPLLKEHIFGVQMDRRGDQQAVFYNAASREFEEWLVEALRGDWRKKWGSFSDVAVIGPAAELNCVNLSAGFLYEHTASEMLFLDAWQRSVAKVKRLVKLAAAGEVPDMPGPSKPVVYSSSLGKGGSNGRYHRSWSGWDNEDDDAIWAAYAKREEEREAAKKQDKQPWEAASLSYEEYWIKKAKEGDWPDAWLTQILEARRKFEEKQGKVKASQQKQAKKKKQNGIIKYDPQDALLPHSWEELSRYDRKKACEAAESFGIELVTTGQVDADDDDPKEVYFMHVIESARMAGLIGPDGASRWEHRLRFSQDGSDPRVLALGRGMKWADGIKTDAKEA